jgi:hypothetical protein
MHPQPFIREDGGMDADARVLAPFTPAQVENLNGYQHSGAGHEFTCGDGDCREAHGDPLVASAEGWRCSLCGYTQNWAWGFMADGSWRERGPWPLIVFSGLHGNI